MAKQSNAPVRSTSAPQRASRVPATFTPYYHQAYNQIVKPRRFDHYLVQRWMRELGPVGFAIVKALRDLCYHNPETGVLRDSVEMTMEELADIVGVSPSTLKRELKDNGSLQLFVSKTHEYKKVGNTVQRAASRWRVSMDEPIHEADQEQYDALLEGSPLTGQNEPKAKKDHGLMGQSGLYNTVQNAPNYTVQNDPTINSLPSGGLITKESNTPQVAAVPPINPPQGEDAPLPDATATPAEVVWSRVCQELEGKMPIPSFKSWVLPASLEDLTTTAEGATATIKAGNRFGRDQLGGKWGDVLTAAFAQVVGRDVTLQFVAGK